ncbi:hypothetical protein GCM10027580_13260 [Corynebacterium faecale]
MLAVLNADAIAGDNAAPIITVRRNPVMRLNRVAIAMDPVDRTTSASEVSFRSTTAVAVLPVPEPVPPEPPGPEPVPPAAVDVAVVDFTATADATAPADSTAGAASCAVATVSGAASAGGETTPLEAAATLTA